MKRSGFLLGEVKRHTEERTVGMVVNRRAGEEKTVRVECSTGQRAAVNHLMDGASQGAFLCVVESRTGGGVYRQSFAPSRALCSAGRDESELQFIDRVQTSRAMKGECRGQYRRAATNA